MIAKKKKKKINNEFFYQKLTRLKNLREEIAREESEQCENTFNCSRHFREIKNLKNSTACNMTVCITQKLDIQKHHTNAKQTGMYLTVLGFCKIER